MKLLRPYQSAALKSLWNWIYTAKGYPLIVAPVGSGKSLMIAEFIRQAHEKYPRTRILVLTHSKELLLQNMEELRGIYPEVMAGFYCAGIGKRRLTDDVTFASIQSIHKKAIDLNRPPNVILIDEVHLLSHKDDTQYRRFIADCEALNPKMKVIGFTGTPWRTDTGHICKGHNALFAGIAYDIDIGWMIEQGYLCRPVVPKTATRMDVSGVGKRGGDYIESQLQAAIDRSDITIACVDELIEHGKDRKRWLIFTAGMAHCEHVRDEIQSRGIICEMVHSGMKKEECTRIIADYKAGKIQCLVNVAMFTTGFNSPEIDLLAFMRPTRSPVLYVQCIGRGVRAVYAPGHDLSTQEGRLAAIAASDKQNCMVLDFGGVIAELGALDAIHIGRTYHGEPEQKDKSVAALKICPSCGAECAVQQRFCYSCGYQLIQVDLAAEAEKKAALLAADIEPEELAVIDWTLSRHVKKGHPDATPVLKVAYHTYAGKIYEWICFGHANGSWPRRNAEKWHDLHMPEHKGCYPDDVDEALHWHKENAIPYAMPNRIVAKKVGKYWEFVRPVTETLTRTPKSQEANPPQMLLSDEEIELLF